MKRVASLSRRIATWTQPTRHRFLRRLAAVLAVLALLAQPVASMSPARAAAPVAAPAGSQDGNRASLTVARVDARDTLTWRGGAADSNWSNPANWAGGRVPGPFDLVRFTRASRDALVDPAFAGTVAGVVIEPAYAGTLRLGRDLTIQGDLVIGGGTFAQNEFAITAIALSQSGGAFQGGAAQLWISNAARVSGGVLTTPHTTLRVLSLDIRAPGVVRLASNGALRLAGDGTPLTGDGLLDTLTNRPNSVEYTGHATADLTAATPYHARASALPALPLTPAGFSRSESLTFTKEEGFAYSAVVDLVNGFAYFGASAPPVPYDNVPLGVIVKVRLSDFTRVGQLVLNVGESNLTSAVIDTANGFAYFGTNAGPAIVVKVRLSDFTRVGAVTLNAGENYAISAVIDPANGLAYLGTGTGPGIVVKVDVNPAHTFARLGAVTLDPTEPVGYSAVIDTGNGLAYFGTAGAPGKVVKVDVNPAHAFARLSVATLNSGENSAISAVIDTANGFAYFGTNTSPGIVVKVDVNPAHSFARIDAVPLNTGENLPISAVIDPANGFAYFGTKTSPGIVVKVDVNPAHTLARSGALPLNAGEDTIFSAVIDAAHGSAYFGTQDFTQDIPGIVVKVDVNPAHTLARTGAITLAAGEYFAYAAVIDKANGFAYFGLGTSPAMVVKVRLSDFTRVGVLTLNTGENLLESGVIDPANGFAYFGTGCSPTCTSPGIVVKVDVNPAHTFARVDALTLNTGEYFLRASVIDTANGFAYFGTGAPPFVSAPPGFVVKVRLSDFHRVGAVPLNAGETDLYSAAIDVAHGFAYFGTGTAPGKVVKVDVNPAHTFIRVDALTLNTGEDSLNSAVIDTTNGFAYFGTGVPPAPGTPPGIIVKVRLSDFHRVDALTLNAGENDFYSAVIDTANGFAYFGGHYTPGIVVRIRLSDFTRVDALTLNKVGEEYLSSAVIDVAHGFAYFGTEAGVVVKVSLAQQLLFLPLVRR